MHSFRFWFPAIAITFISLSTQAADTQTISDKRLLSTISIPSHKACVSDVSNDGHFIYAVCDSKPAKDGMSPTDQAKLHIYDISDLHNPHKVSETDIGQIEGFRLVVRNNTAFYQQLADRGINIIDIRNPQHPKPAGHISTGWHLGFRVSDDGQLLIIKIPSDQYSYIDVSDPYSPKEVSHKPEENNLVYTPGKWMVYDSDRIAGINGNQIIRDSRSQKILISDHDENALLQLYDVSVEGKPKLLATFAEEGSTYEVHIIPGTQAVVFGQGGKNGDYVLKLSLAANAGFDLERLKQTYKQIAEKYSACLASSSYSANCVELRFNGLAKLKDAGIDNLIDENPIGLTKGERIVMLNNYGFWLYEWHKNKRSENINELQKSASILKKVLELAPDRAVAWLNLGDVLYEAVPLASTETAKIELWKEAKQAFNRYKELTGKEAPSAAALASFDLSAFVTSSHDACDYISHAWSKGHMKEISSPKGTLTANGKTVNIVVGLAGGTCGGSVIKAEGYEDILEYEESEKQLNGFHFADPPGECGGEVTIVPFRGEYYTISSKDDIPDAIVAATSGPVCTLNHHYEPSLVENKSPAICEKFLKGELKHNVKWSKLSDDKTIEIDNKVTGAYGAGTGSANQIADVVFNGQVLHFGHYNYSWGGGSGCDQSGLVLLDKEKIASIEEEPGLSLILYQNTWWHCNDADADLIQVGGETYVDAWGGERIGTPHVLLQFINGAFEPICRVDQGLTITPATGGNSEAENNIPPKKKHHKAKRAKTLDDSTPEISN